MGVSFKDTQFFQEKFENKIISYMVTSKLMDLYVFFGIFAYLIVLYLIMQKLAGKLSKAKQE